LFAHGFGQTRGAWNGAATALAEAGLSLCDVRQSRPRRKRSRSEGDGEYHMDQFADDLMRLAEAQPQPPILVGASMGGLLGMVIAGEMPVAVPRAGAGRHHAALGNRWRGAHPRLHAGHPDGFADYAEASEQIAGYLPQRRERKSEEQLRPLLREGPDGRLRWHWDPALLAGVWCRKASAISRACKPRPRKIDVPVLLLSGARSDVVSRATVNEFLQLVPHAQHVELPHATHMVAGDANDAFTREVARFVQSLD
jgi:pimeloyl-ACP methyl ester carboxylesterase